MWLTGFDVPACSMMHLDKPMKNHTLVQAIARANRNAPDDVRRGADAAGRRCTDRRPPELGRKALVALASPAGFEPTAPGLGIRLP